MRDMHDSSPTSLRPPHRTNRTVTLFKSSASMTDTSFSPITIFRPMALNARAYDTTIPISTPQQDNSNAGQPIASGSKDPYPSFAYHDERPGSMTRKASSTSSVQDITGGRLQNPLLFSTSKVPFLNRKLDRSRSHKPTPDNESRIAIEDSSSSAVQAGSTGVKASKPWAASLRARTVSSKSGSAYSQESIPTENLASPPSKQGVGAPSDDSLKSGVSNQRVVGRGGSGSRPRVVVADIQMPTFEIPTSKGSLVPEHQPVLRPSGRGGLASRPQPLAPLPPSTLPKSTLSSTNVSQPLDLGQPSLAEGPVFVRPGGRGGAGSRVKIVAKSASKPLAGANNHGTTLRSTSLLARLQKRKLKPKVQSEQKNFNGESPEVNYGVHPIRESMALRIVNGSSSTLSTIQFNTDLQPQPHFFSDELSVHNESVHSHITLTSLAPEDMSWTPTNTFSSSNSDFISSTSVNETPDEQSQLDTYYIVGNEDVQETRPTTPTYQHQRTLNKLTRTLGEAPSDVEGSRVHTQPKLAIKTADGISPSRNGKGKGARRASMTLSVSSIFLRPRRGSTGSELTVASGSDDPHLSNCSDAFSEARGSARYSYSTTPGSPMLFAAPSPSSLQEKRQSRLASPQMQDLKEDEDEGNTEDGSDADEEDGPGDGGDEDSLVLPEGAVNSDSCEIFTPSPPLSRSQSVTLNSESRRRSTWRPSHTQSVSLSVLDAGSASTLDKAPGASQTLPTKSHPTWLFPPDDDSDDPDRPSTAFSAMLQRQTRDTTEVKMNNQEQGWTGEWNGDLQDVIKSLRSLH